MPGIARWIVVAAVALGTAGCGGGRAVRPLGAPPVTPLVAHVGAAANLTAYRGDVLWSRRDPRTRRWSLMLWHAGALPRRLPVAARPTAFDADAGPGVDGRPVVVFSRCARDRRPADDGWRDARGCKIMALDLTDPTARPRAVPRTGGAAGSDTTPSAWRGHLAVARTTADGRQRVVLLDRAGTRPPRRLPMPPAPASSPTTIDALDLGARVATFVARTRHGAIGVGEGWSLQVDRLDGRAAGSVSDGFESGACGFRYPDSPTADGLGVRWVELGSPCDGFETVFGRQDLARHTRDQARASGGLILGAAADGPDTYWLRGHARTRDGEVVDADCHDHGPQRCDLLRARRLPWRAVPDGASVGPEPEG